LNGAMKAGKRQWEMDESDLGRWRVVGEFNRRIGAACERVGIKGSFADARRQLELGDYLSLFLFGLLNPVVRTMRGLCACSSLERVQREVCRRPVSLGSFSEAQAVLDFTLLQEVFAELAQEVGDSSPQSAAAAGPGKPWMIVDSTLWEVLPRMRWALWRNQGCRQNAVRLHLSLHVVDDIPLKAGVSAGRLCERRAWQAGWKSGDAYVGDRYFGEDYRLFGQLEQKGCSYVLRLRNDAVIELEEELPVQEEDKAAHVLRQGWAHLGCKSRYRSARVRLIWVQTPREVLLLVTNQDPQQMNAALVAELYHKRWQVELFFRWIKCILGCRHWLAESPKGVAIQIHLALIAALLLQLHSQRRPTRRMLELIQFHLMGMASEGELEEGLERELLALERAKNKKS
jgi:hypothetical protein